MISVKTPPKVTSKDTHEGRLIVYVWQEPSDLIILTGSTALIIASIFMLLFLRFGIFPIIWTLFVWLISYIFFAKAINKTTILINESLSVRHGPLPWVGGFVISSNEVSHVYFQEEKGKTITYNVELTATNGSSHRVLSVSQKADAERIMESMRDKVTALKVLAKGGDMGYLWKDSTEEERVETNGAT